MNAETHASPPNEHIEPVKIAGLLRELRRRHLFRPVDVYLSMTRDSWEITCHIPENFVALRISRLGVFDGTVNGESFAEMVQIAARQMVDAFLSRRTATA